MTAKQRGVVKRWVNALRSGKYKQGIGTLKKGDKFCCLGVLCDLAQKARVIKKDEWLNENESIFDELSNLDKVIDWVGLNRDNDATTGRFDEPIKFGKTQFQSLVDANDGNHKLDGKRVKLSFKQIAKLIESKPKGLFQE